MRHRGCPRSGPAGASSRPNAAQPLSPGSTLLLYTDGLIEIPGSNVIIPAEHVFAAVGEDFRFAFDEVGEFLQSFHLDSRDLLDFAAHLAEVVAGAVHVLRELDRELIVRRGAARGWLDRHL